MGIYEVWQLKHGRFVHGSPASHLGCQLIIGLVMIGLLQSTSIAMTNETQSVMMVNNSNVNERLFKMFLIQMSNVNDTRYDASI